MELRSFVRSGQIRVVGQFDPAGVRFVVMRQRGSSLSACALRSGGSVMHSSCGERSRCLSLLASERPLAALPPE